MVKAVVTGVGTLPFFQPGQGCSDWVKVVEKTSSFSTLVKAVVTFAGQGCSDFNLGWRGEADHGCRDWVKAVETV